MRLYMQPVQDLTIDATIARAPYHFVLEDANPSEFATWVPKLVEALNERPELADVASDLHQQGLAVDIVIDAATASRFGIDPMLQRPLTGLSSLYLPSSSSSTHGQVPLSAIAHIEQRAAPLLVTHYGQFPATTVSFNTAPGYSLESSVNAIKQTEARLGLPLRLITAFQGTH